jgi:hypothetical protein
MMNLIAVGSFMVLCGFCFLFVFSLIQCSHTWLSEASLIVASEFGDGKSSIYPPIIGNSFAFKLHDRKGRVHRFTCGTCSIDSLHKYVDVVSWL